MCDFISYIGMPDKSVRFLTGHDLFETERGAEYLKWNKDTSHAVDDYTGHGAIRWYYKIKNNVGQDRECADFSTPDNFPSPIVTAIKCGLYRGLGTPDGLLRQAAGTEYKRIMQPAYAEYERIRQPAYAEYVRIKQVAEAEYVRITQAAYAEYERIRQATFWDLFANPENRNPAWR